MTEREKRYTPGPWEEVDYDDFEEAPIVGVRMRDVLGGYRAVAAIHDQDDQTEANAYLIAAAPELLEAAEIIEARIAYYASLCENDIPNIEEWAYTDNSGDMARLRSAIAKAYGETP